MSFLAVAIVLASQPAAPDWQVVRQDAMETTSWDRAGVVRNGDLVQVPVKTEFAFIGGYGVFIFEIRCSDSRFRTIRTYSHQPDGEVLTEETPRTRFGRIHRDSSDRLIRDAVC